MTFPFRRFALPGIAAAALSAAAGTASALTSSSSVQITSFAWTTSAGSTLSWTDPYQTFAVSALNAGGLLASGSDAYDTPDYGFAAVGTATSNATAAVSSTTPQTFWATAGSNSSVGAATNLPNQGASSANQSGSFTLSTAGTVTFSIGYRFDVAAAGGNALTDYGWALLAFDATDSDGSSGAHLADALKSFAAGVASGGSGGRNGTFTLAVDLTAGETGYYSLQGNALAYSTAAAVPEPETWLLMAVGIAGIATGARRPRRQHTAVA